MLITEKVQPVFNKEEIRVGMLLYAKHSSWSKGIGGFVTTVTDKEIIVQYHPGIGNVTNHFIINVNDVSLGHWQIRYSDDLLEIGEYKNQDNDEIDDVLETENV
jgi:hypothetical protein|nr:MAG TPA: protein of unknown function (DUF5026) [Caudoviricetes sp.]